MTRFTMTPTRTYTATLIAVTAVSLAGNVAHAIMRHNGAMPVHFTLAWFAVPPLLLPLAVHVAGLLARRPQVSLAGADWRYRLAHGWAHRVTVAGVAAVAVGTFAVSFVALRELTSAMGAPDLVATIFPVTLDLLAGLATVALLTEPQGDTAMRTAGSSASTEVHQSDALAGAPAPGGADDGATPAPSDAPTPSHTEPASHADTGDDAPASGPHHAPTSGDAPTDTPAPQAVRPSDDLTRTTDFDVVRPDAPDAHQSEEADPLLALAHQVVQAGRTTADPETVYMILVRTAAGASSRQVAAEVGEVSYSAVQRIAKAAREVSQSKGEHPALSLVG